MEIVRFMRELELFQEELKKTTKSALEEIARLINEELNYRIEHGIFPPLTNEEKGMEKLPAVRCYRRRTGLGLKEAVVAWDKAQQNTN